MAGSVLFNSLIVLSFIVASLMAIVPLPEWAIYYRPEWVALMVVYWVVNNPERVGIGVAWMVGIMVDALTGSLFGLHALGLALVAWLALRLRLRLRLFGVFQQASVILVIIGLQLLLSQWLQFLFDLPRGTNMMFLAPAVTSALFWPLAWILLGGLVRSLDLN